MKVYIVTEAQMKLLTERLDLQHMRANNILGTHDPKRFENSELFRAFNFVVHRWIDEVGKT